MLRTIQQLFSLLSKRMHPSASSDPQRYDGIEVPNHSHSVFSPIRILDMKVGQILFNDIAQDVIDGYLPTLTFRLLPRDDRQTALQYITDIGLSSEDLAMNLIKKRCEESGLWKGLLLVGFSYMS